MKYFGRLLLLFFLLIVVLNICTSLCAFAERINPLSIVTDPVKLGVIKLLYLALLVGILFGFIIDLHFIINSVKNKSVGIRRRFANSKINLNYSLKVFIAIILCYFIFRFLRSRFLNSFPLHETFIYLTLDALFKILSCVLIFSIFQAKTFGLNLNNVRNYPKFIIKSYLGLIPLLALIITLNFFLFQSLHLEPEPMKSIILIMKEKNILNLVIWFLGAVIIAPIFEELIFRGLIYGSLRKRFSFWLSAFLSAVLFSLLHNNFFYFLPILTLGTFFSYAYERTNNILVPMCLHGLHNLLIFIILIIYKIYLV